uniref:C-type lectin domain-containing protein n=1 Tax=Nothoprocta perdicaria TaxID=30464 RepID=A0A8C7EGZ1_NOTPE
MSARCSLPLRGLLGCLLLAALVQELGASSSCPSHWLSYRGHCYGYFTQRKTWQQAEKECERYGPRGHLASVHTFPERKVLAKYVAQHLQPGNVWIGLHDEEHVLEVVGQLGAELPGLGAGAARQRERQRGLCRAGQRLP